MSFSICDDDRIMVCRLLPNYLSNHSFDGSCHYRKFAISILPRQLFFRLIDFLSKRGNRANKYERYTMGLHSTLLIALPRKKRIMELGRAGPIESQ